MLLLRSIYFNLLYLFSVLFGSVKPVRILSGDTVACYRRLNVRADRFPKGCYRCCKGCEEAR